VQARYNLTFDMNSLIELERETPATRYLEAITHLHELARVDLQLVAISAAERQPDGIYAMDLYEFKRRVAALGLGRARLLQPAFRWGITFPEWSVWADAAAEQLERAVHGIVFPRIDFTWQETLQHVSLPAEGEEQGITLSDDAKQALYGRWRAA